MAALSHSNGAVPTVAERNLRLLETGDYHDFVITCGNREFKIHRNIVCPQSSVLASLCNPAWKEGSEGCANLKEEDPEVVEQALRLLYTGSYDRECPCWYSGHRLEDEDPRNERRKRFSADSGQELLFHIRVYILGDYLDVEGLKMWALEHCRHHLTHHFEAPALADPIALAFANTKPGDSGLRTEIVRQCVTNSAKVKAYPTLELLLQDQEPLAWSLLLEGQRIHDDLQKGFALRETAMNVLEASLRTRSKDLDRAHENLRSAVKLANQTKQCRNETCDKEFGAALETYANGYIKSLRCKRCNCRHSITQA